jgi:hypothetical protein
MADAYRNNVIRAAGYSNSTFDPPLDALFVTAAAGANVTMTVSGTSVAIPSGQLTAGTLFEVGDISAINAATGFAFIGLRVLNKSGSSNVTNDTAG